MVGWEQRAGLAPRRNYGKHENRKYSLWKHDNVFIFYILLKISFSDVGWYAVVQLSKHWYSVFSKASNWLMVFVFVRMSTIQRDYFIIQKGEKWFKIFHFFMCWGGGGSIPPTLKSTKKVFFLNTCFIISFPQKTAVCYRSAGTEQWLVTAMKLPENFKRSLESLGVKQNRIVLNTISFSYSKSNKEIFQG